MSLDRLKFALDAAEVGLWDWDILSGELWWSENLAAIHGRRPDEFDGTFDRFVTFIHPDDRLQFLDSLDHALKQADDFEAEFRVEGMDGAIRWITGRGRVFRDQPGGLPIRVIGIGFDTTSRREKERAAQHLAAIALASNDAIVAVDSEGNVTAWNPGAERLFGFDLGEMLGSPISRIVPADRTAEIQQILSTLAQGRAVENFETARTRKDGSTVLVSISSGPPVR
jgi:PAS domain S-box-containing protein